MSEQHDRTPRDGEPDAERTSDDDRVLHVSVGRRRRRPAGEGTREAHVARIHDLPSLIRAMMVED